MLTRSGLDDFGMATDLDKESRCIMSIKDPTERHWVGRGRCWSWDGGNKQGLEGYKPGGTIYKPCSLAKSIFAMIYKRRYLKSG